MNPVFPSILSTNFFDLEAKLKIFSSNGIEYIHLDVMDGHFVDNISFGPFAVQALQSAFPFKIDSHLMVSNPSKMIPKFIEAGTDWLSFHVETGDHIRENIRVIREAGCKPGLVLNPDTAIEAVYPFLDEVDYVLLMSVFPGYGGQKFIPSTLDRVIQLKERLRTQGHDCLIQVDGGLNSSNIGPLKNAGADLFVMGTFLYNAIQIDDTINEVLNILGSDQ